MKVSDAVFDFLSRKGVDQCFAVSGGAAAHLFDSISRYDINIVHMHHEQACSMAADGYARIARKPAVVLVTNGPGVSNAITGVLGAFQDSIPMIVISGQVPRKQMLLNGGGVERQFGVQEVETSPLVKSIVKSFISVTDASQLSDALNKSWKAAVSGRPGPVWIEIPLDVQSGETVQIADISEGATNFDFEFQSVKALLEKSRKPLIVIGGGVHTSAAELEIIQFANRTGIPVVSTWGANDIFDAENDQYIGNFGILGRRIANYAIQKADLLLILGTRLSIPNTGYATELFSPGSVKIMINIDKAEMTKSSLDIDLAIQADLKLWLSNFEYSQLENNSTFSEWRSNLKNLEAEFGLSIEEYIEETYSIDSYQVVDELSESLPSSSTLVTDMGTSFTCTMQAFRNLRDARLFTSSGTSSMGFGLPGAIGAYFADQNRPIYLIAGDGGFQMNIQELQTVIFHKIPLRVIILNSNGYLAISIMQNNSFAGNLVGSTPDSGVDAPDFSRIASAYGFETYKVENIGMLRTKLNDIKSSQNPILLEIRIPSSQVMRPRSQSLRRADGSFYSQGLEVMWPYLTQNVLDKIENSLS
jgi:acetolactate synthase-1/2/3 large subunit